MKLKDLQPNTWYDLHTGVPAVVFADNDGSYLFRYNISENMTINEDGNEEHIGYKCREIRIWERPSKAVLKKAVIRSVVDETEEFALVNTYNKHVLGIHEDEHAVEKYKEYLLFTEELDEMLNEVLTDGGYI